MSIQWASFVLFLFAFLFGSVIASFLNVVIYRLPLGISVAKGRSFCPDCHNTLKPYDMIPVLSWFLLGGKCRFCQGKISFRYPLVEFLGGVIAILAFAVFDFTLWGAVVAVIGLVLLTIAFIDWDTMTIYLVFQYILLGLAVVSIFINPGFIWSSALIGAVIISVPMAILTLIIPGAFGLGDIELMCVCGFLLGWQLILVAFFIALLSGAAYGVVLLTRNKENAKAHFPFGPFLALGIYLAMLWGNSLIQWYLLWI